MISRPIPTKWLSEGFDRLATPEILAAYDLPDYPGPLAGEGFWCDLYLDEAKEWTIGRLWTNLADACGLLWMPQMDADLYTQQALQIRLYRKEGLSAKEAFDRIATKWWTGPVYQGNLDNLEPEFPGAPPAPPAVSG